VVEYNPRLDVRGLTGMVAAKVVKELAATASLRSRDEA
jgi:arginase family enzyme